MAVENSEKNHTSETFESGTTERLTNSKSQIDHSIEASRSSSRHGNLLRKLVLSVILVLFLLVVLLFGRDRLARQEYHKTLQSLSHQLDTFKSQHQSLPTQEQFQQFEIQSRNLNMSQLTYQMAQIVPDSPPESILVHTPILHSRFHPSGCGIIRLDGQVQWLNAQDFQEKLAKDQQFYRSHLIENK